MKCKICGKEFTPIHKQRICCSDECSRQNSLQLMAEWREKHRNTKSTPATKSKHKKICAGCGKEFKPRNPTQIYCCSKCYRQSLKISETQKKRGRPTLHKPATALDSSPLKQESKFELTPAQRAQCDRLKQELLRRRELREQNKVFNSFYSKIWQDILKEHNL